MWTPDLKWVSDDPCGNGFNPDSILPIMSTTFLVLFSIATQIASIRPTPTITQPTPPQQPPPPPPPPPPHSQYRTSRPYTSCAPPALRASRLVGGTAAFVPVLVLFSVRMADVSSSCARVNFDPTAVVLSNIIPFVLAATAWLRALVDCLLVRSGSGLTVWMWPPVMPLGWAVLGYLEFVRWAVGAKNGRGGEEDVELGGVELGAGMEIAEEEEGLLVGGEDGDGNGDSDRESDEITVFGGESGGKGTD